MTSFDSSDCKEFLVIEIVLPSSMQSVLVYIIVTVVYLYPIYTALSPAQHEVK